MDERSSLQFRSNIYPTSGRVSLINDTRFLASISDPEALDILWRYNGSRGSLLTKLQQRQHDAAKHCRYAEEGDFPWGTPVGSDHVVCLCEKADCPLFGECTDPQPSRNTLRDALGTASAGSSMPSRPSVQHEKAASSRAGNASATRTRTKSIFARGWSEEEKRKLREAYPLCTKATLYKMFPHRSASDVDLQIDLMGLASLPQPRRTKPKWSNGKAHAKQPDASQKPRQQPPKKKHYKTTKNAMPWTVSEDVVIRKNFPRHGSDMAKWNKQLHGRKRGDIEARAKQLGLRYRPDGG